MERSWLACRKQRGQRGRGRLQKSKTGDPRFREPPASMRLRRYYFACPCSIATAMEKYFLPCSMQSFL
jgi:hypothetical protein